MLCTTYLLIDLRPLDLVKSPPINPYTIHSHYILPNRSRLPPIQPFIPSLATLKRRIFPTHLVANFNIGIFSHYHASTATLALLLNLFKIHLNFNSINGPSFESFSLADSANHYCGIIMSLLLLNKCPKANDNSH